MYGKLAIFCACGALGLLLCASLHFAFRDNAAPAGQPFVVEEERDLGMRPVDTFSVEIQVRNGSRQAGWIMGMDKL
jgi:hypothetical protein